MRHRPWCSAANRRQPSCPCRPSPGVVDPGHWALSFVQGLGAWDSCETPERLLETSTLGGLGGLLGRGIRTLLLRDLDLVQLSQVVLAEPVNEGLVGLPVVADAVPAAYFVQVRDHFAGGLLPDHMPRRQGVQLNLPVQRSYDRGIPLVGRSRPAADASDDTAMPRSAQSFASFTFSSVEEQEEKDVSASASSSAGREGMKGESVTRKGVLGTAEGRVENSRTACWERGP